MIRFSLVIKNKKDEYLICECPQSDTGIGRYEFLGGDIDIDTLPDFEWLTRKIVSLANEKVGVDIDAVEKYEMYWVDSPHLWVHLIFTAAIKSGNLQKGFYTKLLWQPIDKINANLLNMYGKQVYKKISECSYCHFIHNIRNQSDIFFNNFLSKQEENISILETLENANEDNPVYMLAFKQEMIHLRACFIESTNLKKNITMQNYFRLYNREDLSERIDAIFQMKVNENLSLRDMVKESVDKYIAHYDKPSYESDEIYKFCIHVFSEKGKLPLKKFIQFLNGYIMALLTEMWYDAGELGITMSECCTEQRNVIVDFGNDYACKLIEALSSATVVD